MRNISHLDTRISAVQLCLNSSKRGGGARIAVDSSLNIRCRGGHLELYERSVCTEVSATNVMGNYYLPLLYDATKFIHHFQSLKQIVDFSKHNVHIYGDFNRPSMDWQLQVFTRLLLPRARKHLLC